MREHAYAVYIVADQRRGVLYTGVTSQLPSRAQQHRDGEISGFTRRHGCKSLVWFETHDHIEGAIRREKLIKRWRRAWKIALVEARNPEWADLAPALRGEERFPWESMAEFQVAIEPEAVGLFRHDVRKDERYQKPVVIPDERAARRSGPARERRASGGPGSAALRALSGMTRLLMRETWMKVRVCPSPPALLSPAHAFRSENPAN